MAVYDPDKAVAVKDRQPAHVMFHEQFRGSVTTSVNIMLSTGVRECSAITDLTRRDAIRSRREIIPTSRFFFSTGNAENPLSTIREYTFWISSAGDMATTDRLIRDATVPCSSFRDIMTGKRSERRTPPETRGSGSTTAALSVR